MSSIPEAEVILAVDVGSINTRASLFDVVDGSYRLIATSRVPSTNMPPFLDVSEGVRLAMEEIEEITGRRFMDENEILIVPTTGYGEGIDALVGSISGGPPVRVLLAGLMPDISLASSRRLADSVALDVVAEITPADERLQEEQIDAIVAARPDIILLVGGTDQGARDPLLRLIDIIGLAVSLIPERQRPQVIFAGNPTMTTTIVERLAERTQVSMIPNIRPSIENEELGPARTRLAETLFEIRSARVGGYQELLQWSGGELVPSAEAFGRLIHYLSNIYEPDKGVLGVDLGATQVTIAGGFGEDLHLTVNPRLGAGRPVENLLESVSIETIARWLPVNVSLVTLRNYIYNKSIHPQTIPTQMDELHMEYAIARELVRTALHSARRTWPSKFDPDLSPLLPPIEPIVASGATLANAPRPGYAALVLLDALQPIGITTLVLDPYGLASALGAMARLIPIATVQLLEAGILGALGTAISPVGRGRAGRPVLRYQLEPETGGASSEGEVQYGQLVSLPLAPGTFGKLTLKPLGRFDVGFGAAGRGGTLRVSGGTVGVIIDARGRPLSIAQDAEERREQNLRWLWDMRATG